MRARIAAWATSIPGSIVLAGLLIGLGLFFGLIASRPAGDGEYMYNSYQGDRYRVHKETGIKQVATREGWKP